MIDLGVLEPGSEEAHLARGRRSWRTRPRLGVALLAVAVLLTLAGAGGPGNPGLRMVSSLPFESGAQYTVDGDRAFIADSALAGSRVSGYDLASGRRRWTTPVTVLSTLVDLRASGGVLLASMYAPGVNGDHTVALDESTGRVLWRNRFSLDMFLPGGRALLAHAYPVDTGLIPYQGVALPQQLATSVQAVDLRTGTVAWSYAMAAGCQHATPALPGEGTRLAVLCPSGDLRMVDLATGRTVRTAAVAQPIGGSDPDPLAGSGQDGDGSSALAGAGAPGAAVEPSAPAAATLGTNPVLSVVGSRLLIGSDVLGTTRMVAYDADLRPLWTVDLADPSYGAYACADQLCVADQSGLTVLDPATGRVRWHTAQHVAAEAPGYGTEPAPDPHLPGAIAGDLLVQPLGDSTGTLVAAGTGEHLLDLDRWEAISAFGDRLPIFGRWQDVPDGRTWFGILGGSPLSLHTIGLATDVLKGQCRSFNAYLVCETLTEHLRIWRYHS